MKYARLLLLLVALPLRAQPERATLEGTVRDIYGTPLIGVNVILTGTLYGDATDATGHYLIAGIPAGTYTVRASAVGYVPAEQTITLAPGEHRRLDFALIPTVIEAPEVVVTAARRAQLLDHVPVSLSVLPLRDVTARGIFTLDDALRYIPGVQMSGNQVNIRGSSGFTYNAGSRVLLLIDGFPMLSPDADGVPFELLPIAQIDRIEVLKGPGSALYGSGALGGVIQVLTRDFPEQPETEVRLSGGAYAPVRYAQWRARWAGARRWRPFGTVIFTHARRLSSRAGGWLHLTYLHNTGHLNFSKRLLLQGYTKLRWQPAANARLVVLSGLTWRRNDSFLYWNGLRDPLNPGRIPTTGAKDAVGANDTESLQWTLLPAFTHAPGSNLFYTISGRLYVLALRPLDDEGRPKPLSKGTLGFRYGGQVQLDWQPAETRYLTFGASADAVATRSSFFPAEDGHPFRSQPEVSVFGQWEEALTPRWRLTGGLRFDAYQIRANRWITRLSPRANVLFQVRPNLTLHAAFGLGFRVPGVAERYIENQEFFPIVANPDLRPETSTGYELGLRFRYRAGALASVSSTLALFWTDYRDLVEPRFQAHRLAFQFVNLTRARIRGLETTVDMQLLGSWLKAQLGYTLLDADDLTGPRPLPLSFRSRHLLKTSLTIALPVHLRMGADLRLASRPERIDTEFARFVPDADVTVPIRVLDLRLSWQRAGLMLTLLIKNALDYYYVERPALLAPPRHLQLQLQWRR
ncbi:TonB-dependent receptor [Rhodothermus profundi]|uniref:Iron complex outermembrane recepter protein n=1 Tax=Rhodothermus profundi TaxID=633813 RepID=A0A1M6WGJ4_9BACT|nr:TonB-dependent receptor [Rhodothermus profundi]SHK92902.1 iron complex outermembrane recepter protein [Rhodothermus profundi]